MEPGGRFVLRPDHMRLNDTRPQLFKDLSAAVKHAEDFGITGFVVGITPLARVSVEYTKKVRVASVGTDTDNAIANGLGLTEGEDW